MSEKASRTPLHGSLSSKLSGSGKFLIRHFDFQRLGINFQRIGRLSLFYFIFYGCLALFSFNLWWLFTLTLNPRVPTRQLTDSLIGESPGLGFRPMPSEENVLSTLIWYQGTKNESFQYWKQSLIDFLLVYTQPGRTVGRGQNIAPCSYQQRPKPGQVCDVVMRDFSPCVEENHFMYHQSSPCVFVKLNKIFGWKPEFYRDPNDLPRDMPQQLKNHIRSLAETNDPQLETVWLTCKGETPADEEFINSIEYKPFQGFPGYFFPYVHAEGYLSPLVAVHFIKPRTGILINIECRAWAKNIIYNKNERRGSFHFELMID